MLDLGDELTELSDALARLDLALMAYRTAGQDLAESGRLLESIYVDLALLSGTAKDAQDKVRLELGAPTGSGTDPEMP